MPFSPVDMIANKRAWAAAGEKARRCGDFAKDESAKLLGTVQTVFDLGEIVSAIGGDRRLRFWGEKSFGQDTVAILADG